MVICDNCGAAIFYGRKILHNGIKYVCATEYDVNICKQIQKDQLRKAEIKHNLETVLRRSNDNNVSIINCNCGKTFYTNYELETCPPKTQCPYCNTYHSKKM